MPALPAELIVGFLVALGGGLLIGVERERRKGSGAGRALAGVRTFTLAAMAGAMAQALEQPWLVAAGAAFIIALGAIAYSRSRSGDPGVTTELALFVTYLLGVAAIPQPAASAAGAVIVAALLAARSRLHRFSTEVLTAREMRDALLFAGAALVLLPLVPDTALAWLGGTNPRTVWTYAVIIMAMQAGGYIAQRWLGARRGLALSGFASGFVSSTATIAAMGARMRGRPALLNASVAGALFSTMATYVLFAVIVASLHWPSLAVLAMPLAAGLACTVLASAWFYLRDGAAHAAQQRPGRAFNLWHATGFALGIAALSAAVGIANEQAGTAAAQAGAAIAGFLDAHAAGASLLSLAADGRLPAQALAASCLLGISTNALSKAFAAFVTGGARYGACVSAGLAAGLAGAWAAALLLQ
jgi:uncharacterized membrane protein (DUF4010 family)